jgi:thioredoxin reductase
MTLVDLTTRPPVAPRLAELPVAIIGAGPVGLAAAAHLVERGIDFIVYEAGKSVAASVRSWGHIRLFSPWKHLIDPAARRLLEAAGWSAPRYLESAPSGSELVDQYLVPLARLPEIASRIRFGTAVSAVSREGMDRTRTANRATTPLVLRVDGADVTARAVIDASGTYRSPNSLGASGIDPVGLAEVADLVTHALPDVLGTDRARFRNRHVTVVGAGHSAANTILALATLVQTEQQTRISWVIRNGTAARVFTADDDELAGRASLGARLRRLVEFGVVEVVEGFEIVGLRRSSDAAIIIGHRGGSLHEHETDLIVNATGFRPDLAMLREIRLDLDDIVEAPRRLAPLIDPNVHSCGTVEPHGFAELQHPEPGFFIAGMKSYGRAPTFLLATGYEQVRSIAAWLDGDLASATAVELVLPATGVCSTDSIAASCC